MSLEKVVQNTRTFLKNVRRLMSMITSVTLLKGCAHGSAKTGYYPWISMIHTLYLDDLVLPHTDASQPVKSKQSVFKMKTLFDEFEQEFIEIQIFPSHFALILLFDTLLYYFIQFGSNASRSPQICRNVTQVTHILVKCRNHLKIRRKCIKNTKKIPEACPLHLCRSYVQFSLNLTA